MNIKRFFQNDKGDVVIAQWPNVLISLWVLIQLANLVAFHNKSTVLSILGSMVLFAWAYDEQTRGDSPFRKALGGVVLVVTVIMVFLKWHG